MTPYRRATEEFESARPMLTGLAYRILGSLADAEDVVQDTFLDWMKADVTAVERPRGWLKTVCTRKAIDVLKSARRSRTEYVGIWLPEPLQTHDLDTPESQAALSESVTTAFLLVLERLAPKERAAFLLHDVFALGYDEVAGCLEISEPACRKLVSRARTNVQRANEARAAPPQRQDELVAAFKVAIVTGATTQLASLLAADVTLSADGGGKVVALQRTLEGAEPVLGFVAQILAPAWRGGEIVPAELNAGRALLVRHDGRTTAAVSFAFDAAFNASRIFIVRNPDKLARIDRDFGRPDSWS